ncbi:lipid IV(A) 3-deoxy-D-manno-octulosonic acid transferase [Arcobacter sp. FWKO B]|uniref:lipid IV(A) 3-deoxy-D-manno-octulosonic acid transferase n=1 Tax=Arcobacter sp. FWKO B TaxID=2593672 RepID=UPI0018A6A478|nr:lipid IV(A) 3-deoxy-D-manno-octulosonic acid transferase [Arcobacter sp. FWKO B]QOG12725.1 3-deoxy-D-manno-octulosonic acid transferase [Arcobacter sp. FWKO B]
MFFTIFYYTLAVIVYIISLPFLIYKSFNKKYKVAIPAKFFLKNNPPFDNNKIWFHCCSFGEVRAIKPIIDKFDNNSINLSVITNTGYAQAQEYMKNVRYLPFEIFLPFWIKKQKALVVVEAELWYMLFFVSKLKGTKTILINARISDATYHKYKRFSFLYKKIFDNIDKVYAQSEVDKNRLIALGAKEVVVIGNIKLATLPKITKTLPKPDGIVITAASTHESEEELILKSYNKNYGKLIIVPRHPERFDKVYELIGKYSKELDCTYSKYSNDSTFESDIILVDCMGELNNIYSISDVVILCGSFVTHLGGHNPIEPAYFGCKIISGENIFNQKALFEAISGYKLIKNNELKEILSNLDTLEKSKLENIGSIEPIISELLK